MFHNGLDKLADPEVLGLPTGTAGLDLPGDCGRTWRPCRSAAWIQDPIGLCGTPCNHGRLLHTLVWKVGFIGVWGRAGPLAEVTPSACVRRLSSGGRGGASVCVRAGRALRVDLPVLCWERRRQVLPRQRTVR
eukprot:scaffold5770_cov388-Prasinococcus_capsulatus_cf.AAC.10